MHRPPKEKKNKKNKTSSAPKGALFFVIFLFYRGEYEMKNSVNALMTLEGTKEELKSLRTKTKAWASKKCLNGPSVDILDIGPICLSLIHI